MQQKCENIDGGSIRLSLQTYTLLIHTRAAIKMLSLTAAKRSAFPATLKIL